MDDAPEVEPQAARRRDWPRWTPLVLAIGAVAGFLGRNLPVELAARVAGQEGATCHDSFFECARDNLDDIVGGLLRFAVALVVIGAVGLLISLVLGVLGGLRRQPWLVAAGIALLMPIAWQTVALVRHGMG